MISVEDIADANGVCASGEKVALGGVQLLPEEESQLHFIDAELEEVAVQFRGDMFHTVLSLSEYSISVVSGVKRLWESGGWIVGVFRLAEDRVQVVFAKPRSISQHRIVKPAMIKRDESFAVVKAVENIPERRTSADPDTSVPLLVRMPTRGRPEQALRVLTAYRELASSHVKIEVVVDEDDQTMCGTQMLQQLCDLDCVVTIGRHRNKIDAVNGGRVNDWAILALASDDMMPIERGYDERIIAAMDHHFPLRDGAVYFDDGYNKSHAVSGKPVLCTMPIMGRHLWEDFGYVYYSGYGSLYSDNEQTELLTSMRRIAFVDEFLIEHRHYAAGKAAFDVVYQHNDYKWGNADKELFEKRAQCRLPGAQFAFEAPPLVLSILVCSTRGRRHFLERLERHLRAQMRRYPRQVELVVDVDNGEKTIGQKRNDLLARAVGNYVAFIDDDDWVAHDYVDRLVDALRTGEYDCASLEGVITYDGERPERFTHSIEHEWWYSEAGVHYRSPNHLNAVRRELALKVGFPTKNFGEDHDFSNALRPLLKTEAKIEGPPLYMYWWRTKK